jgi:SAM-dependent methyltransferase
MSKSVNHGKTYDHYYSGDDNSIYHELYHDEVIPNDKRIIRDLVAKQIQNKNSTEWNREVSILDYGCGDGRFFNFFKELADELNSQGMKLTIIGYDPSLEGLKYFAGRLHKQKFTQNGLEEYKDFTNESAGELAYTIGSYTKDNLNVKLVHGHVDDKLSYIADQVGSVDLAILMFCVLAHVVGRDNRVELLKMLDDISSSMFYSVPGPAILSEYQYAFDVMRDKKISSDIMSLVQEDGDIVYTRVEQGESKIQNYLHIYNSTAEVKNEVNAAAISNFNLGINKIFHETHLINHPWLATFDMYASQLASALPEQILDISLYASKPVNWLHEKITGDHHLFGAYYMVVQQDEIL